MTESLKQGTLRCPCCNEPLHFEIIGTMRVITDGVYNAKCPTKGNFYTVDAPKQNTKA